VECRETYQFPYYVANLFFDYSFILNSLSVVKPSHILRIFSVVVNATLSLQRCTIKIDVRAERVWNPRAFVCVKGVRRGA